MVLVSLRKLGVGTWEENASRYYVSDSNLGLILAEGFFAYGYLFKAVYCGCTEEKTVYELSIDFWLNYFCWISGNNLRVWCSLKSVS